MNFNDGSSGPGSIWALGCAIYGIVIACTVAFWGLVAWAIYSLVVHYT